MKRVSFFPRLDLFFSDVKKVEFLPLKSFLLKITNSSPISIIFFSTKVWVCKSENLVLCDHPTKIDIFCTVQHLTSILKFFKLIFPLNLKLRYAVEISEKKILIFEKFEFSTFTEKKNQGFWTRIDQFRNCFRTLAYLDVTWSISLIYNQIMKIHLADIY